MGLGVAQIGEPNAQTSIRCDSYVRAAKAAGDGFWRWLVAAADDRVHARMTCGVLDDEQVPLRTRARLCIREEDRRSPATLAAICLIVSPSKNSFAGPPRDHNPRRPLPQWALR